jgi:SagB-type dehydrogenase family enzyme
MTTRRTACFILIVTATMTLAGCMGPFAPPQRVTQNDVVLPPPSTTDGMALTEALAKRRSVRSFSDKPVAMEQISQLCWAAQGITDPASGKRTAPSAMALYAVNVYLVNKDGCYEYLPALNALRPMTGTGALASLRSACWQPSVGSAPVCLVITVDVERLKPRCGKMAEQYSLLEAGHVAQNILLQATALGLASVPVGGADEAAIAKALTIPAPQRAVYLLPVGYQK